PAQLHLAGGEQRRVQLIEQAAVLADHARRRDRALELGAGLVAPAHAHRRLVARERVGLLARAGGRVVLLGERALHPLDEAAGGVRVRGAEVIADRLERLARERVILAEHEQLRRLADPRAIALGRDALGAGALVERLAERGRRAPAQRRILAG